MKLLIYALAVALCLFGCNKQKTTDVERAPSAEPLTPALEPKPAAKAPETAAASSAPAIKSTGAPAASSEPPPPQKVAVSGTVWAVERISITTDDGVFSVPAGTALQVVRHTPTGYTVAHQTRQFEVTEAQISATSAAAVSAVHTEFATRSADAAWKKAQLEVLQQQNQQAAQQAQAAVNEKRRRDLDAQLQALAREEGILSANLERARQEDLRANDARYYNRVYTRSITPAQVTAWSGRLAVVRVERDRISAELWRMRQ